LKEKPEAINLMNKDAIFLQNYSNGLKKVKLGRTFELCMPLEVVGVRVM